MSAGGIAANSWSNYVKDYVGDHSKVYTISDSGVFNNFKTVSGQSSIEQEIRNVYAVANIDESTPSTECNKHFPGEEWKCIFLEYSYPFIEGRFMVINS